jgi:hypothetical protein
MEKQKRRCNSKRVDAIMPWDPHEELDLVRIIPFRTCGIHEKIKEENI